MHNQPREQHPYEDCQAKSIQEFEWTSQGMDWGWGQGIESHHTQTMNSLFSSTLDTVAPLRLRKFKEKSPTPWYNEHTRTLKRAARKMERSWRKTKLEVFRIAWRESTLSYRKALKTARSDYFSSLLEQNKHNPRYLFNTVAKLTKNKALTFPNSTAVMTLWTILLPKLILLEIKL